MLARVKSAALLGLESVPVEVEVNIEESGFPAFNIVGLPDKAVEESKERVRSAIKNSGGDFPARRITVNLAPADLPKEGPSYDLPIALGILIAWGKHNLPLENALVVGELSLDGSLRPVNGALSHAALAKRIKTQHLFLPYQNAKEASLIGEVDVFPVESLLSVFTHLQGVSSLTIHPKTDPLSLLNESESEFDFSEIQGQESAKRALEIAAAGGHNVLLKGPPGAGKTFLGRAFPSILPRLELEEALEVTKIYSVCGLLSPGEALLKKRPFRGPHHTTSDVGLVGGGARPKPGEISLSHRGVLFLDEFPEFARSVLEALRQPLEDGFITVSRAQGSLTFPAKFILVAAQNPCPCGFHGDPQHRCICTPSQIVRYHKRVSGPILDRIDLHLDVPAVEAQKLVGGGGEGEKSGAIRERVKAARERQKQRFAQNKILTNAEMSSRMVKEFCPLSPECLGLLRNAVLQMKLSARAFYRVIKLARTIADLAGEESIAPYHLAEALQYRPKERGVYE